MAIVTLDHGPEVLVLLSGTKLVRGERTVVGETETMYLQALMTTADGQPIAECSVIG